MARFSHTSTAKRSTKRAWAVLQDAGVWGTLLGASKVSHVQHSKSGELLSCDWKAKIGGRPLVGSMRVIESVHRERMVMEVLAEEWLGKIEMELTAETQRRTSIHARARITAEGFTALLALPVVTSVIGRHFPDRMEDLVEIIENG